MAVTRRLPDAWSVPAANLGRTESRTFTLHCTETPFAFTTPAPGISINGPVDKLMKFQFSTTTPFSGFVDERQAGAHFSKARLPIYGVVRVTALPLRFSLGCCSAGDLGDSWHGGCR
jgi:hypothetical protein